MYKVGFVALSLLCASCAGSAAHTAAYPSSEREWAAAPPEVAASRAAPEEAALARRFAGAPALAVLGGQASYYGDSLAGHATASGEPYEPRAFTAASRHLPFGTVLRVIREPRGPVVYVRVNDRGPFGDNDRILDLSRAAAERLDMIRAGVVRVRAEVVAYGARRRHHRR
jgi:peptidoglycan lytic transglycosylase